VPQIIQSERWKLHKIQKKSTNYSSTCGIATRIRALLQEKTTFKRTDVIKWYNLMIHSLLHSLAFINLLVNNGLLLTELPIFSSKKAAH
jgi:hypothetical protein